VNSFASNNLDEVIMKVQNDLKVSKAKDHLLTISGTVTMSDFSRLSEIAEETGKNVLVGAVYDDENQNVLTTLVSY
jgi:cell division GTPase FtsZ